MSGRVVECVPNFSEGRRAEVIDAIAEEVIAIPGVKLLDKEMDPDHNRAVLTFAGDPDGVAEAAFRACAKAAELIDLRHHSGQHPRIGATDVIPFVPLRGVEMADCVELAQRVGERIGEELGIPVYLYESAATRPDRVNLADVRRGEFEGLRMAIETDPERAPDFGPRRIHPSAGATAVGARLPLVAFNVNLGTSDLRVARRVAKALRHRDGGLRYVKALGMAIQGGKAVQVSMNLTDYRKTPLHRAFEMVKMEAERHGVPVTGSEVIGLIPLDALVEAACDYLRLHDFRGDQVLEKRLWEDVEKET